MTDTMIVEESILKMKLFLFILKLLQHHSSSCRGQPEGRAALQAAVIHAVSVKPKIATKLGAVEEKFE